MENTQEFSEYTAAMVHDLKAPLRHIIFHCEFLKDEAKDRLIDDDLKSVNKVINAAKRMQHLVDDLSSYARIFYGTEERQLLDLNTALQEVLNDESVLLEESGATVNADNLPALLVHPPHMRQLLRNLITNAIKYRREEKPVITIKYEDKGTEHFFSIRDNGLGIPPEHLLTIFKPFKRLHSYDVIEGSGLGLSICTRIIEFYKGKIWVDSTPGDGSTFFFTIPKE